MAAFNELGTLALQNYVRRLVSGRTPDVWASSKMYGDDTAKDDRNAVTIVWRVDVFEYLGEHLKILHGGVGGVTPLRVVRRVHLRHRATGKHVWRQGTHTVHRVEREGIAWTNIPGQLLRAQASFPAIAEDVVNATAAGVPLEGTGDLNVDYLAELRLPSAKRIPWFPLTTIGEVADFANPARGTHGNRCIDQRWIRGAIRVHRIEVLPKRSSDHNPVLAVVELT